MIKKVNVDDLKVGMFVHDFNFDWSSENIYIEKTLLKTDYVIDILRTWGVRAVYIDTERGLDIEKSKTLRQQVKKEVGQTISTIIQPSRTRKPQVPLSLELQPAREITQDTVKFLQHSHQQVLEGKALDVRQAYGLANRIRESIERNQDALLLLTRIRNKDEYTLYHSISVSSLVLKMCHYLRIPDQQTLDLAVGALFHDIGKAIIPEKILKKPGKLNEEEYHEIKRHAEYSINLLQRAEGLPLECYDIALHHHERFDGKGYPRGLKGNQISFGSRLTCICDVFDAVTSERCYKSGVDTVMGLRTIYEGRNLFFSTELADDFIRCIGVYPVGSCVVLDDGRSGVVVSLTDDLVKPVVYLLYDENNQTRIPPQRIDLSRTGNTIVSYGDPTKFGLTPQQVLKRMVSR